MIGNLFPYLHFKMLKKALENTKLSMLNFMKNPEGAKPCGFI